MSALATQLPTRRPDLVVRPFGERGMYVIKDPGTGDYFHVGAEEQFLLLQLDGRQDAERVCHAFSDRFGQPLTEKELQEFVELARGRGFLESAAHGVPSAQRGLMAEESTADPRTSCAAVSAPRLRQSILYWRKSLFDPDRLITWLEPKVRFFWTPVFLALSAACIVLAAGILCINGRELATHFAGALRWETLALVWLTLFVVTMLHEFAHGLTCKHYGGEVHEIGFLLMFFMPCFYCNVSDAWLFREKSKRLWVTFAGGYFELSLWALAVIVWRLVMPDTLLNYLAFVVLSVCGIQTLFNFNPLLKLDGYYLLSDWAEIPNLRQNAWGCVAGHVRWLLWGAPRPKRQPHSRFLFGFGLASWTYSLLFLALMLWAMFSFLGTKWGWLGMGAVAFLGLVSTKGLAQGLSNGEIRNMIRSRHSRTAMWLLILAALAAVLCYVEIEDRASGSFELRPRIRAELRAPVAGFVREVHFDEGDRVSPGALIVRLEVPDLGSRKAQKQAEVHEAQAKLRLLKAGTRSEEIDQQRRRVERMMAWRDLAQKDLTHARKAFQQELARLDQQVAQYRAELAAAEDAYQRAKKLTAKGSLSEEQKREAERRHQVAQTQLAQAESQKRHREALGTREAIAGLDAEAELARREKDLADAEATLTLLQAGTRPEEIDAARAALARINEELRYLERLQNKILVTSPLAGVIITPRLKEKVGQYLSDGELIGVVEELGELELEIGIAEEDVARVQPGQHVEIKARALPFETFATRVDRIAPAAARGDVQSRVTVYCRLEQSPADLRSEMSGYARIYTGRRSLGEVLFDRVLRLLRTEFWW